MRLSEGKVTYLIDVPQCPSDGHIVNFQFRSNVAHLCSTDPHALAISLLILLMVIVALAWLMVHDYRENVKR